MSTGDKKKHGGGGGGCIEEDEQPTQVIDIDVVRFSKERAAFAGLYDLDAASNCANDSDNKGQETTTAADLNKASISNGTSSSSKSTVRVSALIFVILIVLFVCLMEYLSVSGYLSLYSRDYLDQKSNCNSGLTTKDYCDTCSTPDINSPNRLYSFVGLIEIQSGPTTTIYCLGTLIDRTTVATSFSCLSSSNMTLADRRAVLTDLRSFKGNIGVYIVDIPEKSINMSINSIDIKASMARYNVSRVTEIKNKNKNGTNVLVIGFENSKPLSYARYACLISEPILDISNLTLGLVVSGQVDSTHSSLSINGYNFIYIAKNPCFGCRFGSFWIDLSEELKSGDNKGFFADAMIGSPYFMLSDMGSFDVIGALN